MTVFYFEQSSNIGKYAFWVFMGLSGKVNGSNDTTHALFGWGWVRGSVYVCMFLHSPQLSDKKNIQIYYMTKTFRLNGYTRGTNISQLQMTTHFLRGSPPKETLGNKGFSGLIKDDVVDLSRQVGAPMSGQNSRCFQ